MVVTTSLFFPSSSLVEALCTRQAFFARPLRDPVENRPRIKNGSRQHRLWWGGVPLISALGRQAKKWGPNKGCARAQNTNKTRDILGLIELRQRRGPMQHKEG
nr:hypothetical protein [Pandoravirus massiliensis]